MRKWLNWIGLGLMVAAAGSMIAADAFAGDSSLAGRPQGERAYVTFDLFSPSDLSCSAAGADLRVSQSRDLLGRPVLRLTGNARDAEITCSRPDGSLYRMTALRGRSSSAASPLMATVTFRRGRDAMTTVLRRDDRILDVAHRSFVRVQ